MIDAVSCQIQQYIFFVGICRRDMLYRKHLIHLWISHDCSYHGKLTIVWSKQPPVKNKLKFIIKDFCDKNLLPDFVGCFPRVSFCANIVPISVHRFDSL